MMIVAARAHPDRFAIMGWLYLDDGTDITLMHRTWRECVTLFTEELPWLKGADLELVMGRAFCDWIGWDTGHRNGRGER